MDNYPISLEHFHLAGVLDMENVETVDVAKNEEEQRFDTAPVDTPVVSGTLMTAEESTVVGEDWKTVLGLRLEGSHAVWTGRFCREFTFKFRSSW